MKTGIKTGKKSESIIVAMDIVAGVRRQKRRERKKCRGNYKSRFAPIHARQSIMRKDEEEERERAHHEGNARKGRYKPEKKRKNADSNRKLSSQISVLYGRIIGIMTKRPIVYR